MVDDVTALLRTVMLGSTTSQGLHGDLFDSGGGALVRRPTEGQAEQPCVMLFSVPYALKAGDAATVGGLPPSAFVLVAPPGAAPQRYLPSETPRPLPPANPNVTTSGGTVNALPLFTTATNIQNSALTQTGTGATAKIGVGTTTPAATLDVKGSSTVRGLFTLPAAGTPQRPAASTHRRAIL
jgi:hypothetical protein